MDPCFPKYKYRNKEKALEEYWDDYYRTTSELTKKYQKMLRNGILNRLIQLREK